MNEYINLTLENIDEVHICCAIGDKKHQVGVDSQKKCLLIEKMKLKRKLIKKVIYLKECMKI